MLIALIDDGIDETLYKNVKVKHDYVVSRSGRIEARKQSMPIITDHGTTCAGIIASYVRDVEFCSIRIFKDARRKTTCDALIAALKWCEDERIPIVHLSIGTIYITDYERLRPIIAQMLDRRQMIVAAHNNMGGISCPACIGGVFAVVADAQLSGCEYRTEISEYGQTTFHASAAHVLTMLNGQERLTQLSNSYAAPTITARICELLQNKPPFFMSVAQVMRELCKNEPIVFRKPDFLSEAYIINHSSTKLYDRHLIFKPTNEENSLDLARSVIYLPSKDECAQKSISELRASFHELDKLVYCGEASVDSAKDILFWSETMHRQSDAIPIPQDIDCSIVYFIGEGIDVFEVLLKQRELFLSDGYDCMCISDNDYSYLYGIEYTPNTCKAALNARLNRITQMHKPDAVLCTFTDTNVSAYWKNVYTVTLCRSNDRQYYEKSTNRLRYALSNDWGDDEMREIWRNVVTGGGG